MTVEIQTSKATARLIQIWAKRYIPDLSSLSITQNPEICDRLLAATSPQGRSQTVKRLTQRLVDVNCQFAGIRAKTFHEYIPNILDLNEARRLTEFAAKVYLKLLEVYQAPLPVSESLKTKLSTTADAPLSAWGIPEVMDLAKALNPLLRDYQRQHILSKDWRALGFLTTQWNFSNLLLLEKLSPIEKVLLSPYLRFVEEQVALPWQRVCEAAADYDVHSLAFRMVEQMMPKSRAIAASTFKQLVQEFPTHHSRRGLLTDQGIAHSCLRDLEMFQGYLWLSVLKEHLDPIQQELVALCIMVMQSMEVKWELTERWNQVLVKEIIRHLTVEQQTLFQQYAEGLQDIFRKQRLQLGGQL
jgi:hypothetical protein